MASTISLTYEDLERFPEDGPRRELIGGELFVSPSPSVPHQDAIGNIYVVMRKHAELHEGRAFFAAVDVRLGPHDVVVPDAMYVAADRVSIIHERAIDGAPTIVVEVLSPSNKHVDLGKKRALYARYDIPEYWIVDVKARTIERCSQPRHGTYAEIETFRVGAMSSPTVTGLTIGVPEIFR
ncbi:MAG TPA: Uma2 family endonuclease [Candidatus Tyrphobacter sp.]